MTGSKVRFDESDVVLLIGEPPHEITVHNDGADAFIAHIRDVDRASATSLRAALERADMPLLIS